MELQQICKKVKENWHSDPQQEEDRDEVLNRYGEIFNPENLENLTQEDFLSFLLYKNNKHWKNIHRHGPDITEDMERLRDALRILLDEERPIKDRLDELRPRDGQLYVKYLGKATLTPILYVVYPDKYGVYNETTKAGMKELGLLPDLSGMSFAEEYLTINEIIHETADKCELDLWQIDKVWRYATKWSDEDLEDSLAPSEFGLEKHLEDFLVDNWDNTPLGDTLEIYEDDGEVIGQQYYTEIGQIDILCTDKNTGDFVAIELKKGRSSDSVVGQLLRYMGYIQHEMADEGQDVRGLIILREPDDRLRYALSRVNDVEVFSYEVTFDLKPVAGL